MIRVCDKQVVTMRYLMKAADGTVLEDTLGGEPVAIVQGSPHIFAALQQQLYGLTINEQKQIALDTNGDNTPDFIFDVVIDDIRPATDEEIASGYPGQNLTGCDPNCSCHG